MEIKIKKENNLIKLECNNEEIETYNITESINFSKLMAFLLKDELKNKFILVNNEKDMTDQENTLINIIVNIVNKYNDKVDDYIKFLKEKNNYDKEEK